MNCPTRYDTIVHLFMSSSVYTCRLSPTPATCDPSTPVFEIYLCVVTQQNESSVSCLNLLMSPRFVANILLTCEEVQYL